MTIEKTPYDAVIVGSGPNGLAAGITLAQKGLRVIILEASDTIGGGTRTKELIRPGYYHDVCSAIHPMGISSPFFNSLNLESHGLKWIQPEIPLAHPLENESVFLFRDLNWTAEQFGGDADAYKKLMSPLVENWESFTEDILGPLSIPGNPFRLMKFGLNALKSASGLTKSFKNDKTSALFAGIAAHSILPLDKMTSAAIGLVLAAAGHAKGWPVAEGGSIAITNALKSVFESLGGEIETGFKVNNLNQIPDCKAIAFNLTPFQVADILKEKLPSSYMSKLRKYKYGPGVFKIDYILNEPVPWSDSELNKAGTVHLGGSFSEIAESEKAMSEGRHSERPYVLLAQQSLFDDSRTPDNKHTLWAYCHVPSGSERDMTQLIENQIERYAPGFRDVVDSRATMNCSDLQHYNPNYIGGDINGGLQDITQLFNRPVSLINPYSMPAKGYYFASSSTPPGGGVHGMCGFHAAKQILKKEFYIT
jgi:phytoene dehydrogenase-like protein